MVKLRPDWLTDTCGFQAVPIVCDIPGFVIHPSTSELAELLMVDPTALSNENYSGVYDENGDYIPQYADDPEQIPQGQITPNPDSGIAPPSGAKDSDKDVSSDSFSDSSVKDE